MIISRRQYEADLERARNELRYHYDQQIWQRDISERIDGLEARVYKLREQLTCGGSAEAERELARAELSGK